MAVRLHYPHHEPTEIPDPTTDDAMGPAEEPSVTLNPRPTCR